MRGRWGKDCPLDTTHKLCSAGPLEGLGWGQPPHPALSCKDLAELPPLPPHPRQLLQEHTALGPFGVLKEAVGWPKSCSLLAPAPPTPAYLTLLQPPLLFAPSTCSTTP